MAARQHERDGNIREHFREQSDRYRDSFFDGSCPLCATEIGMYRRCSGADRIDFVDVSDSEIGSIEPRLDAATALARFHVRTADGALVSGAKAFGQLWVALPAWRWLGRVVLLPGVLQATEVAYRGFLVLRPAIQRIFRVVYGPAIRT